MAVVTYNGTQYQCSVAYKGSDYVHLVDANGNLVARFDGVCDFSGFSITDGSWTTPSSIGDCNILVVGNDNVPRKGSNKLCDIGSLSALNTTNKASLVGAINEVFTYASDGKDTIAAAIGYGSTADMTWDALADNMPKIVGYDVLDIPAPTIKTQSVSGGTCYVSTYTMQVDVPFNTFDYAVGACATGQSVSGSAIPFLWSDNDRILGSNRFFAGSSSTGAAVPAKGWSIIDTASGKAIKFTFSTIYSDSGVYPLLTPLPKVPDTLVQFRGLVLIGHNE